MIIMKKKLLIGLGIFFIGIACIILLTMNSFIFPMLEDGPIDILSDGRSIEVLAAGRKR